MLAEQGSAAIKWTRADGCLWGWVDLRHGGSEPASGPPLVGCGQRLSVQKMVVHVGGSKAQAQRYCSMAEVPRVVKGTIFTSVGPDRMAFPKRDG